ncbi:MAG: DUF2971 domain-containing protein [Dokdonella sp.]|uniref:DUF2971 domain-containing protein n=1 Tax=Dokdonella sp. TaxID=2291710 RepID=UPI0031C4710E|nr:DUF2971 domain-containing protein [Xanthomonadales bacterium]
MRLYHFLKEEHGLSAIRDQRIKIARISELNDPFEHIHFDTSNYVTQAVLKERRRIANQRFGLVCLSARFDDPVQWAHYGDSHRGICLGFEVADADVIKVEYIDSRTSDFDFRESLDLSLPDFLRHALSKKFKHWQYEQEHRLIVPARKTTDLVFHPFSASFRLTDVMIGARSNLTFASIRARIKSYPQPPAIYKMKASPVAFAMEHLT